MTEVEIKRYLSELNDELKFKDIKGEISLYGGAVMVLEFNARITTNDIDAIFYPSEAIRSAAVLIAERHGLPLTWLNDGVKGYIVEHSKKVILHMTNLTVYVPEPEYLLAMKALAARADTEDENDVLTLIAAMKIGSPGEVFEIIEKYYPYSQIPPRTQYFIEGLFEL